MENVYFQRSILQRLKEKLGADFDIYDDEYVDKNLLKVDIFYRELRYKEIIERPGYEVCKLSKYIITTTTNDIICSSRRRRRRVPRPSGIIGEELIPMFFDFCTDVCYSFY